MEDILFPGCGTLLWRNSQNTDYTDNPLTRSWWEINTTYSNFEYPAGLWPKFQAEYYGPDTPRLIWTLCGQHAGSHCLWDADSALKLNYNGSLANAVGHYAIWRYFTGGRDDNLHFYRAESCTTAILHARHTTYPASGDEGSHGPYCPGGMDLIEFVTDGNQNLTLSFDGQDGYNWRAYVVATRGTVSYEHLMLLDANAAGSIVIPAWEVDTAVLIPVSVHWTNDTTVTSRLTFTYSAGTTASTDIAETNNIDPLFYAISQSPVRAERIFIHYTLPANENGDLKITDAVGRVVRNAKLRGTGKPAIYVWDKRDRSGAEVEAGVYFYQLSAKNKTVREKIIVVK